MQYALPQRLKFVRFIIHIKVYLLKYISNITDILLKTWCYVSDREQNPDADSYSTKTHQGQQDKGVNW